MPNWAEGVLKLRGTRENIAEFLRSELEPIDTGASIAEMLGQKPVKEHNQLVIETTEWDMTLKSPEGMYIKGTRRAFIESTIDWYFNDSHQEVLTIESFKQAWGVEAEPFVEISRKYNLDIKIYVFEKGMQFNQEIEIHKGELIKDNEITFDDYQWECLMPNLGG